MLKDIVMGAICLVLGGFTFSFWWFAMFSGSDWGEAAREMLDGGFNLGRNTIAVIEPALVVRWVLWSAARLVLPSGQALGKRLPTEQIVSFTSGGIKGFLSGGKLSWLNRY